MLLATKLFLPAVPPGTLARQGLFDALDSAWDSPIRLFLLSAPPGYGKTTLLASWVQERRIPTAWISLESSESEPVRFLALVVQALKPFLPGTDDLLALLNVPQRLLSQGGGYDHLVAEVINRAARLDRPVLLVLDDYHLITSTEVHELFSFLLAHLPPRLRLAVLTREDPPFNLPQMRARRQLLELRASELSFSELEGSALLLDLEGLPLDSQQVRTLLERSEGWAAGLQLAVLALRGRADIASAITSFSGSHRFILDYLAAEVLDRLPAELRRFLCESAVLDRFNASLCDAALRREDSRAMIHQAAGDNLFLIPLDDQRDWFRYHHLMADILKAELEQAERRAIQARAARWWLDEGHPEEAVPCALGAIDYGLASEAIRAAAVPAAETGMLAAALSWLDALPAEVLLEDAELSIVRIWFLIYNGRFREAASWLQQVSEQQRELPRPLQGLLTGLQTWMRSTLGQPLDLQRLQTSYDALEGQYRFISPLLLLVLGQAQREQNDLEGARRSFLDGAQKADEAYNPVSALILRNNLAFLLNEMGERAEAAQLCQAGMERHTGADGQLSLLGGIPLMPLGIFLYESGRLEEAQVAITQSINLVRRLGMYDTLSTPANMAMQNLLTDTGHLDQALALNAEVRRRAEQVGLPAVRMNAEIAAAWLSVQFGERSLAEEWAARYPLASYAPFDPRLQLASLVHARLLWTAGEAPAAVELLDPLWRLASQHGRRADWLRHGLELALAHHAAGSRSEALAVLEPLVDYSVRTNSIQIWRRNATALAPLAGMLPPGVKNLLGDLHIPRARVESPALVEQPVERELEILRLVAAGMSNAEIAGHLFLTTGTVKWYLNQLFGKLGVGRRTEAVARAQQLGLL